MSFFEGMDYEQAEKALAKTIQQERERCEREHYEKVEAVRALTNEALNKWNAAGQPESERPIITAAFNTQEDRIMDLKNDIPQEIHTALFKIFEELNELYTPTVTRTMKIDGHDDYVYEENLPHPVEVMIKILGYENTWDLFGLMRAMADKMREMVEVTLEE